MVDTIESRAGKHTTIADRVMVAGEVATIVLMAAAIYPYARDLLGSYRRDLFDQAKAGAELAELEGAKNA